MGQIWDSTVLQHYGIPLMTAGDDLENLGEKVEDETTRRARERIRGLLAESGMRMSDLSRRIGRDSSHISQLLGGKKTKQLTMETAAKIAQVFGVTTDYLYGKSDIRHKSSSPQTIPIQHAGGVETGVFRTMENIESQLRGEVREQPFARRPDAPHIWFDVYDNSMSGYSWRGKPKPIMPGMIAVCADIVTSAADLAPGKVYAIRRSLDGGRTWETVLRRVAAILPGRVSFTSQPAAGAAETFDIPLPLGAEKDVRILGHAYRWLYDDQEGED